MFTTAALDVHPAGMEAYLLNSGDTPLTPNNNNGGIESKTWPQTPLYSFLTLISLRVVQILMSDVCLFKRVNVFSLTCRLHGSYIGIFPRKWETR
jgi:hypothetical protein